MELQAWVTLAEVGMRVMEAKFGDDLEWTRDVPVEVEKALSKALVMTQKHPSLRSHATRIVLLSAKLATRQHNHKYAQSLLKKQISTLSSTPPSPALYESYLEYINILLASAAESTTTTTSTTPFDTTDIFSLPVSTPSRTQGRSKRSPVKPRATAPETNQKILSTTLTALHTLSSLAQTHQEANLVILCAYIRYKVLFSTGYVSKDDSSSLSKVAAEAEAALGLEFPMDEIRDGSSPKKSSETKTTLLEAPIRRTGGGNGDKSPFLETTNVEGSSSVSRTSSGKSIDQENLGPHPPLAPQKLPADTVHKPIVDAPATESTPAPSPHETYLQDTYLATMKIHVLTLSVLYYTNQGNATESNKRLNMLHGVMDAFCVSNPPSSQADSPSKPTRQWGPGDGTLLVPLSSATSLFPNPDPLPANRSLPRSRQYLTMQTTHPDRKSVV